MQLPTPQLARFRGAARRALVGYAALTIALYFLDDPGMTIGYVDKAIEVALVALLLAGAYRARSERFGEAPGRARQAHDGAVGARLGLIGGELRRPGFRAV